MVPPADEPDVPDFHNYAPWVTVVLGLLVFVLRYASPRGTHAVHWNLFLTGIVILFASLAATISHGNTPNNYWSAIDVVAGVWLLVSVKIIPSVERVTLGQEALGALIILIAFLSLAIEIAAVRRMTRRGSP